MITSPDPIYEFLYYVGFSFVTCLVIALVCIGIWLLCAFLYGLVLKFWDRRH